MGDPNVSIIQRFHYSTEFLLYLLLCIIIILQCHKESALVRSVLRLVQKERVWRCPVKIGGMTHGSWTVRMTVPLS